MYTSCSTMSTHVVLILLIHALVLRYCSWMDGYCRIEVEIGNYFSSMLDQNFHFRFHSFYVLSMRLSSHVHVMFNHVRSCRSYTPYTCTGIAILLMDGCDHFIVVSRLKLEISSVLCWTKIFIFDFTHPTYFR